MRVYLAGPINGCTDAECEDWREAVKHLLRGTEHEAVDPMARDYRGKELGNADAIVRGDKLDILSCDAVIANCPRPSVGTSMEILFAWMNHVRVVAIVPDVEAASPWLRFHARLVTTIVGAVSMVEAREA